MEVEKEINVRAQILQHIVSYVGKNIDESIVMADKAWKWVQSGKIIRTPKK